MNSKDKIKKYLSSIGSKGGKAGTGDSKRRGSKEYYKRIAKLAVEARREKSKKQELEQQ